MKSDEWITVTVEVPLAAIDFEDCGDGADEVYGLDKARLWVGTNALEFTTHPDDVAKAEAKMHDYLGTFEPHPDELPEEDKRTLAALAEFSRRNRMARIAEEERQRLLDDPLSKRRA